MITPNLYNAALRQILHGKNKNVAIGHLLSLINIMSNNC